MQSLPLPVFATNRFTFGLISDTQQFAFGPKRLHRFLSLTPTLSGIIICHDTRAHPQAKTQYCINSVLCNALRNYVFYVGDILKLLDFLHYHFLQLQQKQQKRLQKAMFSNLEANVLQVLL